MPNISSRLSIALSVSGETPITVKAQAVLSEKQWISFAITNRPISTLVEFADYSFSTNINAGEFNHPVATTIAAIWAVQVLSATLVSSNPQSPSYAEAYHSLQRMGAILQALTSNRDLQNSIKESGKWFTRILHQKNTNPKRTVNTFSVISGGIGDPVAHLLALKIGELTWMPGQAYNIEEYIHSPLLTTSPTSPVIFIIPDNAVYQRVTDLVTLFDAHKIPYMDLAPKGIPKIPNSAGSLRFTIDRVPSVYLGIPLLHLSQRLAWSIASSFGQSRDDWRFGMAHTNLIHQG
jgi:glucosamine 6-phosphate synthetase-like amidotransferase/phosphosugar isomerase protein